MSALFLKYLEDFETREIVTLCVPHDKVAEVRTEMAYNRYVDIRSGPHPSIPAMAQITAYRRQL